MKKIQINILHFFYIHFLKRIYFRFDPETIHNIMINAGKKLGKNSIGKALIGFLFSYKNPSLNQTIDGVTFENPVGLSAGFDKNAELTNIIHKVGFGFAEVGSITGEYCEGNSKPRLWRIKDLKSLQVYYGLKNNGAEAISRSLSSKTFSIPIGINIAKTNSLKTVDIEEGIKDYLKAYNAFENIGDYYTINISCPNTFGGQPFTDPQKLNSLLSRIFVKKPTKPIFIKLSPDLSNIEIDELIKVCDKFLITGFICSNLTKRIQNIGNTNSGGFSGKLVKDLSNEMISYIYKRTRGKYIIIGTGGIFNAEDAYEKIKRGASLVQLITGMIYEGPQLISQINYGLVKLLKKDGYKNISEAVGAYYPNI